MKVIKYPLLCGYLIFYRKKMLKKFILHPLTVCLWILLPTCGGPVNSVAPVEQSSTAANTETPASTPITDIYQQNIHLFDYDAESPVLISETSVQQEEGFSVHDINYPSSKT